MCNGSSATDMPLLREWFGLLRLFLSRVLFIIIIIEVDKGQVVVQVRIHLDPSHPLVTYPLMVAYSMVMVASSLEVVIHQVPLMVLLM
jgi:hypothetical protein